MKSNIYESLNYIIDIIEEQDEDDNSKIDFENENENENDNENIKTMDEYNNYSVSSFEKKYMEPTVLENINFDKYFTKDDIEKSLLNNKKLKITDKGLYSISKHQDAKWISDIIKKFLKNENINTFNTSIIDATAGIGGNTISFSKYFSKVYSIEINNIHYDVLNNNIEALSINNVTTYLNNFFNQLMKYLFNV